MANLKELIMELDPAEAAAETERRLAAGEEAMSILKDAQDGMTEVGERFQRGEAYLAELMLSGEIFQHVMSILEPKLAEGSRGESKGRFLFATLQGDIHFLGKNIVKVLLKANGFEVDDVGEDVPPATFIARMKEYKPQFVGFSSLLTPNMQVMKKCVDMMVEEKLRDSVKVCIGGGITTEYTRQFVGADFQAIDAMETVQYCLRVANGEIA